MKQPITSDLLAIFFHKSIICILANIHLSIFLRILVATTYKTQAIEIQARDANGGLNHLISKRSCVRSHGSCSGYPRCCCGYCQRIGGQLWGYCSC
ncbi:unnamed protein product [Rotaria magnacalcarata]